MKKRVLFLCTENAARSQMAEVLLRQQAGDCFEVFSAGTAPSEVDPRTLDALRIYGGESEGLRAKSVEAFTDQYFDYVITLCDKAHEECASWPDYGVMMNWDFADPRQSASDRAFSSTLHQINERIRLFVLVNSKSGGLSDQTLAPHDFYKALGDELRLKSLLLIEQSGELCVCELMQAMDESQPKVSRHLAQLRKSGVLADRRQGQWVYYSLHPALPAWMRQVLADTGAANAGYLAQARRRLQGAERPNLADKVCNAEG